MTDDDPAKRPTEPLLLPVGDRVIIDNQIRVVRIEMRAGIDGVHAALLQHQGARDAEIARFNTGRMLPLEARVDRARDRANVAMGIAIVCVVLAAIRLLIVAWHT